MDDKLHFLASASQTICGEMRFGLKVTRDQGKVLKSLKADPESNGPPGIPADGACQACASALAVTTIKKPDAAIDPPAAVPVAKEEKPASTPAQKVK